MPWGLFGPVHFETKRGTRVTFFAGFITLPLTAWSLWKLFDTGENQTSSTCSDKGRELLAESEGQVSEFASGAEFEWRGKK